MERDGIADAKRRGTDPVAEIACQPEGMATEGHVILDPPTADPLDRKYRLTDKRMFQLAMQRFWMFAADFKDREDRKQFSVLSDERKRAITRAAIADIVADSELTEISPPGTPEGERTFVRTGENPWIERREPRRGIQMSEDEDDKVIDQIQAPPGYGPAYVEMMKVNYRRWAAEGGPIEIVKRMDRDDTEDQSARTMGTLGDEHINITPPSAMRGAKLKAKIKKTLIWGPVEGFHNGYYAKLIPILTELSRCGFKR
jgi:hypothetical protein